MNWRSPLIEKMVISALEEDIWTGDVTSMSIIPEDRQAKGRVWTKVDGVVAGLPLLPLVFAHAGGECR